MSEQTNTPRVDALLVTEDGATIVFHGRWVPQIIGLAKNLERELSAAQKRVQELEARLVKATQLLGEADQEMCCIPGEPAERLTKPQRMAYMNVHGFIRSARAALKE